MAIEWIHLTGMHEAQRHRSPQACHQETFRLDVEPGLVKRPGLTDIIIDRLCMTGTDIIGQVIPEGSRLELFDGPCRVKSLRTFGRTLLAVEAPPETGIHYRLQMLFRAAVTGIRHELLSFDKNERIQEVLLVQCILIALRYTGATQDATRIKFVFIEI